MRYTLQKVSPWRQFSWNIIEFCKFVDLLRLSCQRLCLPSRITELALLKKLCAWCNAFFVNANWNQSSFSIVNAETGAFLSLPSWIAITSGDEMKLQCNKVQQHQMTAAPEAANVLKKLSPYFASLANELKISWCPVWVYCFLLLCYVRLATRQMHQARGFS